MELHKRRKALSEPEVRYLFHQMLLAVAHLHDEKVSQWAWQEGVYITGIINVVQP